MKMVAKKNFPLWKVVALLFLFGVDQINFSGLLKRDQLCWATQLALTCFFGLAWLKWIGLIQRQDLYNFLIAFFFGIHTPVRLLNTDAEH